MVSFYLTCNRISKNVNKSFASSVKIYDFAIFWQNEMDIAQKPKYCAETKILRFSLQNCKSNNFGSLIKYKFCVQQECSPFQSWNCKSTVDDQFSAPLPSAVNGALNWSCALNWSWPLGSLYDHRRQTCTFCDFQNPIQQKAA